MELLDMKCQNCGGTLKLEADKEVIACPFCGSQKIIIESDEIKAAKLKTEIENRKLDYQIEKDKEMKEENSIKKFKEGKFSKFIIVCAIISLLFFIGGFNNSVSYLLSSIIAFVQFVLFVVAWLMGAGIIRTKREYYGIVLFVGFVLIIPFAIFVP